MVFFIIGSSTKGLYNIFIIVYYMGVEDSILLMVGGSNIINAVFYHFMLIV